EAPRTSLRVVLSTAAVLAVRRWYLSLVSLLVVAGQAVLFTTSPALALGLTAAPPCTSCGRTPASASAPCFRPTPLSPPSEPKDLPRT
ncbi:hypothetical protein HR12_37410, partial [Microbacterium sp. SUBG005]